MNDRVVNILKTIVTFDVEKDFEDKESRENLANLFREVIMSDESSTIEFLNTLLPAIGNIMGELGLGETSVNDDKTDTETNDETETNNDEKADIASASLESYLVKVAGNFLM